MLTLYTPSIITIIIIRQLFLTYEQMHSLRNRNVDS